MDRASQTAYRVALHRAAHQLLDRPPVLEDPIAIPILGAETAAALRRDPESFEGGLFDAHMRAFMAARSRFAEDHLATARAAGVEQYVILGAGLDTFGYRQPTSSRPLRIWEVDHPATQEWKRGLLAGAAIEIPDNVSFVPVDFERERLSDVLANAGFEAAAGAAFSWLGVTMYLTHQAIDDTLLYLADAMGVAGGVAFDYAVSRERLTTVQQVVFDRIAAQVAAAGEPWQTTFDPERLDARLTTLGLRAIEHLNADELGRRYFASRSDGLRGGGMAGLVWAGQRG